MKFKDLLKKFALYSSNDNLIKHVDRTGSLTQGELSEIEKIKSLSNSVIVDIASNFIPMKHTEIFNEKTDKVLISSLSKRLVSVISAKTENQTEIEFTYKGEYIIFSSGVNELEYSYIPTAYDLDDDIGYTEEEISLTAIAYALLAEKCLIGWQFDEAVMWRERFEQALQNFYTPKNKTIKERAWR